MPSVAERIFGKYHLVDKIATGGMAEVFRAKSYGVAGFEKTLVIKKILPNLATDKKFVEMFIDEAKIASTLSHINIVQIFDLGSEDGDYFIAMEYVDGSDLKTVVEKAKLARRTVPVNLMAFTCSEVAKGLDYAHRRKDAQRRDLNIVHRDISPHNILVSYAGETKITDFGIARASSKVTITRSGVIRGKFAYMSPEQARGDHIDRRSDIFSLGIVLYEVLTGTRLFKSKNDLETLKRVQTGPITPPSRLNPDVPPELETIVLKALDRDRDRRYQWASELHDDLSTYLFSSGEKIAGNELATWVHKVMGPAEEESDRTTDFDAFVNAIEEIGGNKQPQTIFTPATPINLNPNSTSRRGRAATSDEPTRLDANRSRSASVKPSSSGKWVDEPDTDNPASISARQPLPTPVKADSSRGADGNTRATQAVAKPEASKSILAGAGRLVGRTDELKRIQEILARVARGEGQTLLMQGEDGVGKSRIVTELMGISREIDFAARGFAFYVARARRELSAVPYGTLRELLHEIVGVTETDTEDQVRERIKRLTQLGLSETAEVPFIGAVFGLGYTGSSVPEFRGADRRRAITAVVEKIVQGLARERPMILAIDDIDVADELSVAVLDHIAAGLGTAPVLLMATSTSDVERLPLAALAPGRFHRLPLKPLSEFSGTMLSRAVLGVEELGSSISNLIQQKSAGNPLRIREVIRFLLGGGQLKVRSGRALLDGQPEQMILPATTERMAADAIARLETGDRRIAAIAAAIGERFETSRLAAASAIEKVDESLARLEAASLIRREESTDGTQRNAWRFAHRVFREAAWAALPKEEAPAIHKAIAVDIARLPEPQRVDHLPALWTHLAAAGQVEPAMDALERAADLLVTEGGGAALLPSTEQACNLFSDVPLGMDARHGQRLRGRAWLRHAVLLGVAGEYERAKTALERARTAAEASGDRVLLSRVEKSFGDDSVRRSQPETAAEHYDRARRFVEDELDAATEGVTSATKLSRQRDLIDLEVLGASQLRLAGDGPRALRRCKDALERAQELRESTRVGSCLDELGNIHERLGEHDRAMKLWDLAVGIWMKIGAKRSLMNSFEQLGNLHLDEGNHDPAKNLFREALELARETGDVDGTARLLNGLARAHLRLRQYAPAQALFIESLGLAKRFQLATLIRLADVYLAALTAYTTDLQEGIRALETTLAAWEKEQPDKLGLLQAELLLGNAYKMARRVGPTNQHYVRALGYARDLGLDRYVREITREMKEAF